MKVNEIAKTSFTSPETIRMYRQMGFLSPHRQDNGYYDYTDEDLAALIYLRKLRAFDFSLQEISTFYTDPSHTRIDFMEDKEKELQEKIRLLQEELRYIAFEKKHLYETKKSYSQEASLMTSIDDKIDFYPPYHSISKLFRSMVPQYYFETTTCLYISKDVLNGPIMDQNIPLRIGIGTYRYILDEKRIPIQPEAVVVPHGIHISEVVNLTDLSHINILQLAPMMKLAKERKQPFLSDTTGYLAGIRIKDGKRVFTFRLRACIEKQERPQSFPQNAADIRP